MKTNMEPKMPKSAETVPVFAEQFIQELDKEFQKLLTSDESRELRDRFTLGDRKEHGVDVKNPCVVLVRDLGLRAHAAQVVFNRMEKALNGSTEDKHRREELTALVKFFDKFSDAFAVLLDMNNQEKYASAARVLNDEMEKTYERFTKEVLGESSPS